MGSLYQALARNDFLRPVSDAIKDEIEKRRREKALNDYLQKVINPAYQDIENLYNKGMVKGVNQPYETQDSPVTTQPTTKVQQLTGPPPRPDIPADDPAIYKPEIPVEEPTYDVLGDYSTTPAQMNDLNRQANSKVLELMKNSMTMKDVPVEKQQQGLSLLSQLIQNQQQPKKEIGTVNPEYDVIDKSTGEVIREGKPKNKLDKKVDEWVSPENKQIQMWQRPDGSTYTVEAGDVRQRKGTNVNVNTGNENDYNYSNLYSNVQTGNKEVDKIKNIKLDELEKDKNGNYIYYPPGKKEGVVFKDQNELNQYKEQVKTQYANDAVELMNQRGLDGPSDVTPVKYIRAQMQKGYTYKEAIDAFKKNNPDFSPKDVELMQTYFELMTK